MLTSYHSVVDLIKDNLDYGHVFGRWGEEEFLYMVSDIEETELSLYKRKNG